MLHLLWFFSRRLFSASLIIQHRAQCVNPWCTCGRVILYECVHYLSVRSVQPQLNGDVSAVGVAKNTPLESEDEEVVLQLMEKKQEF